MPSLVNVNVGDLIKPLAGLIDHFFPSAEEKANAQAVLAQIRERAAAQDAAPFTAQLQVDLAEAKSGSVFVAGWRSFIGWILGFGLAYSFVVSPLLAGWMKAPPTIDMVALTQLLLVMLGVDGIHGGLRIARGRE